MYIPDWFKLIYTSVNCMCVVAGHNKITFDQFERLSIFINVQELERELLSACEKGDLDTVRRLSGEVAVSDVRDSAGWSPLHLAATLVDNIIAKVQNCQ